MEWDNQARPPISKTPLDEAEIKFDDEARREFFEVINEESDRLNRFVENMVKLARIKAGAVSLCRRRNSVEEIVAMARARAESFTRGRRLEVEIESELPRQG